MAALSEYVNRLRTAGAQPGDSPDLRLKKQLLMFAMGLMTIVPVMWLALYWFMGLQISTTITFWYQVATVLVLLVYLVTLNFEVFRALQLALFLFFPFVLQWSLGNFISASGVVLWGLLAPISAILLCGPRDSIPWFIAYIVMIAMSSVFDYHLANAITKGPVIPPQASVVFFGLNFALMGSIVYFMLRYSATETQRTKGALERAHKDLQTEQERSERLLLNILPGAVAERLKQDQGTIADGFADVTVMFADIVNFTTIAEGMSPQQIFAMLNRVFSTFDALAEKHGLEKIKTIGDAYMVAGGLNDDPERNYTESIAGMAIEMRDFAAKNLTVDGRQLQLRMGIGTGPVVAGVVGKKKFIYDLWGDTVNIASRITAEGGPGNIQVDLTTYRRLRERFDFDPPQTVYLKGKGDTVIYRLRDPGPMDKKTQAAA